MLRTSLNVAGVLLLPVAVLFMGCSKSATPSGAKSPAVTQTPANKGDAAQAGEQDAGIAAILAALSPEDRALVEKQKTCPVSGEQLGSMGAPVKMDVKGQPVFICCDGCREKLLASPDEYLTKLNK